MTRDEVYATLQKEYADLRAANLALYEQHRQEVCEKCPEIGEIMDARHASVVISIRQRILARQKGLDMAGQMGEWNRRLREKLKENGFPEDYLQPVYTCKICRDEGFVYDPSRRMCDCYKKKLAERMVRETGVVSPDHCFEQFDETVFSNEKLPIGPTQRQLMKRQRQICEAYADEYPNNPVPNMLLQGKSGLGKTYLLECIAHRLAERGYLPVYMTAYKLFEMCRKAYMENDSSKNPALTADILMIDDLGTEPLMNNVTVEQLFTLLNERSTAGRKTLISTNLSPNELRERYTERSVSRMMDPASFMQLQFFGNDVRDKRNREG